MSRADELNRAAAVRALILRALRQHPSRATNGVPGMTSRELTREVNANAGVECSPELVYNQTVRLLDAGQLRVAADPENLNRLIFRLPD